MLTTIAGNGALRYGSDNGPAPNGQLWDLPGTVGFTPLAIAVDVAGDERRLWPAD